MKVLCFVASLLYVCCGRAANENIAVQMKAQSKVLRIVTEEKE